jgi:hypothetical protein
MYFIDSSFSEWSPIRQTGGDEIDSCAPMISARSAREDEPYRPSYTRR